MKNNMKMDEKAVKEITEKMGIAIGKLRMEAGDILVLRVPNTYTPDHMNFLAKTVKDFIPKNTKVMILPQQIHVELSKERKAE